MANEIGSKATVDERRISAWIGTALVVQGKVISSQDLTIDGKVEGTIELGDHGLTIGSGAEIKADLVAQTITISGAVTGNVTATSVVDLRATGSVDGDITTPRLVMADGAVIKGKVDANRKKA
jgi:cytoskeletal protein CcmA (bactofilin family)